MKQSWCNTGASDLNLAKETVSQKTGYVIITIVIIAKGTLHCKWKKKKKKVSHYLLTLMRIENLVKFRSPLNICGPSLQNSVAAFFWITEVDGDLF